MEDIDIARNTELKKINEIALTVGIDDDELELYGKYKAKISLDAMTRLKDKKDGKLILVTAIILLHLEKEKQLWQSDLQMD